MRPQSGWVKLSLQQGKKSGLFHNCHGLHDFKYTVNKECMALCTQRRYVMISGVMTFHARHWFPRLACLDYYSPSVSVQLCDFASPQAIFLQYFHFRLHYGTLFRQTKLTFMNSTINNQYWQKLLICLNNRTLDLANKRNITIRPQIKLKNSRLQWKMNLFKTNKHQCCFPC